MCLLSDFLFEFSRVSAGFTDFRDQTRVEYTMKDIALSAFSLFFMQSESFLDYQRELEQKLQRSNCHSLFGMAKIPTDNHIRMILDEVKPQELETLFDFGFETLMKSPQRSQITRLDNRLLIALDGTEYFCSQNLNCSHCLHRMRNNGKKEYYHTMLCATVVATGHNSTFPLMPEFIENEDGKEKQDCERNAAKRWFKAHGEKYRDQRPVYLGDDLFACTPIIAEIIDKGGDFLLTAKPTSHKTLYDFVAGAEAETHTKTVGQGAKFRKIDYSFIKNVPLNDGKNAPLVTLIKVLECDSKGKKTYENGFITSLDVTKETVSELVLCARARWKIENGSFNVMKNHGYHLEHNFGHGKKNLAKLFATLNLLAFAFHTVNDILNPLWKQAREAKKARNRFFTHLHTITAYLTFQSWDALLTTLIKGKPPPSVEV
jgi:hypothetical protein